MGHSLTCVLVSCLVLAYTGAQVEVSSDYGAGSEIASRASGGDDVTDYEETGVSARSDSGAITAPDEYPDESALSSDDDDSASTAARIINGVSAPAGEFNFIVSLRRNGGHICGGSLLSDYQSVVTAAHCVSKHGQKASPRSLSVAVGIRNRSNVPSSNIIQVSKVIVHAGYDEDSIRNDIAILRLSRSAAGISGVSTVKLPPAGVVPPVGTVLHTAGWGVIRSGLFPGSGSETLLKTTMKLISRDRCSQVFNSVPDSQICTENDRSGTCSGDSGGPLVNRRSDGVYLVGLTSYGPKGCSLRTADAFTKVSYYISWIQQATSGSGSVGDDSWPSPSPGGDSWPSPTPDGDDHDWNGNIGSIGSIGGCYIYGGRLFCPGGSGTGWGSGPSTSGRKCYQNGNTVTCSQSSSRTCYTSGGRMYCHSS